MVSLLAIALPAYLLIAPGYYNGHDCSQEGIVRLIDYPKSGRQRIVFDGNVMKFIESVTWIHVHGYKDNFLTTSQLLEAAKTRKLSMTCQPICTFTVELLNSIGVEARTVSFVTLDKSNGYDDGHRMLEVKIDGKWICVDMTARMRFKIDHHFIGAKEMVENSMQGIELEKFSDAPILSYNDLTYNGYDYTLIAEETFLNEYRLMEWYQRICQTYSYP